MSPFVDVDGRLTDVTVAVHAIHAHLGRAISTTLATEPGVPWRQVARMRDRLVHSYADTEVAVVRETVENDLGDLMHAVTRLRAASAVQPPGGTPTGPV